MRTPPTRALWALVAVLVVLAVVATLAARPSRGSSLAISDVAALERSSGSAELRFTVELSGGGEDAVSVAYSTADETASAADDYAAVSGTLALGRSRPTGIVSVTIVPDALDELDETLTVRLSNGSGAEIADAVGLGSILDDDGGVTGPTIAAAGDIACDPGSSDFAGGQGSGLACRQLATSDLLLSGGYDAVFVLGDVQYGDGALSKFRASYDPSWGRAKAITRPVPGNHEYETASAAGYFAYFGRAAGDPARGYYSFQIGSWHVIALNSNCSDVGGCGAGSPQETWLRADLAAHSAAKCTLAYWHHPRFSSGAHGGDSAYEAFFRALYDANADLVLVGHDHDYERFAPQSPSGVRDASRGIRQFVVGTGGKEQRPFGTIRPNSESRSSSAVGVLRLKLAADAYEWRFVPAVGTFTDAGVQSCH